MLLQAKFPTFILTRYGLTPKLRGTFQIERIYHELRQRMTQLRTSRIYRYVYILSIGI